MDKERITFTRRQNRLITLLSDGRRHSVIRIANLLNIGDPRGEISKLRRKGVCILDEWRTNSEGSGRYKLYFIK